MPESAQFSKRLFGLALVGLCLLPMNASARPPDLVVAATYPSRLSVGQALLSGESLKSPTGNYRLEMEANGRLCLYRESATRQLIWSRGRNGSPATLRLDEDGVLRLRDVQGNLIWNSERDGGDALAVQDDGNLVLYAREQVVWASETFEPGHLSSTSNPTEAPQQSYSNRQSGRRPGLGDVFIALGQQFKQEGQRRQDEADRRFREQKRLDDEAEARRLEELRVKAEVARRQAELLREQERQAATQLHPIAATGQSYPLHITNDDREPIQVRVYSPAGTTSQPWAEWNISGRQAVYLNKDGVRWAFPNNWWVQSGDGAILPIGSVSGVDYETVKLGGDLSGTTSSGPMAWRIRVRRGKLERGYANRIGSQTIDSLGMWMISYRLDREPRARRR